MFSHEKPGFDAIVGNPPFTGGKVMPGVLGPRYCEFIKTMTTDSKGAADLIAYFFRRSYDLLSDNGCLGLLATNSLAQTVSRKVGLEPILRSRGSIYNVLRNLAWPGEAAVVVARIHIKKGKSERCVLDGRLVAKIPATLSLGLDVSSAERLRQKTPYSSGVVLYGDSFILGRDQLVEFIKENPGLPKWIRPYVNGKVLNETPASESDLFCVDFGETLRADIEGCDDFLLWLTPKIVSERANQTRQIHETRPWLHWDKRTLFFEEARTHQHLLVCASPSTYLAFRLVDASKFFMQDIVVFNDASFSFFAVMQSRVHELWAHATAGTLKRDIRYSTSNTFATFAQPIGTSEAAPSGAEYHAQRETVMARLKIGLTNTYTRFHSCKAESADIVRLRELHDAMDQAVLRAYGWDDLAATLRPVFLTPETEDDHTYQTRYFWPAEGRDQVLARLLALNAQRHAEEVAAGIASKGRGRAKDEEAEAEDLLDG